MSLDLSALVAMIARDGEQKARRVRCEHEYEETSNTWEPQAGRMVQTLTCRMCGKVSRGWKTPNPYPGCGKLSDKR